MRIKRWGILLVALTLLGGVGIVIVGLPILRPPGYRALIQEYTEAVPVNPTGASGEPLQWDVDLPRSDRGKARIQAGGHMDVVRLQYPDEAAPRTLYEYEDYSNPQAIRVSGRKLFVYWSATLLHTNHWLLAYDVENRREIERRRVDPKDLPAAQ
jgi:hypothetical protein